MSFGLYQFLYRLSHYVNGPISVNYNESRDFRVPVFITSKAEKMANLLDLTSREIEVLQPVLEGRTNKAIAAEFRIAEKTVEFHLDHICTKLGVRTRVMAGLWAMQQGMEVEGREIHG